MLNVAFREAAQLLDALQDIGWGMVDAPHFMEPVDELKLPGIGPDDQREAGGDRRAVDAVRHHDAAVTCGRNAPCHPRHSLGVAADRLPELRRGPLQKINAHR